MSFLDDAISSVGRGLAQTAVKAASDATGFDVGGTLNALFGNGQTTGGETLTQLSTDMPQNWQGSQQQLQMLQDQVSQQMSVVADLGNQLATLNTAVAQISSQIANIISLLQQINQEQLYQEWQAADYLLAGPLAAINALYSQYTQYLADYQHTETAETAVFVGNILDYNTGPGYAFNLIAGQIVTGGQTRNILQLWSNMVTPLVVAGLVDYRDATDQYIAYYQQLAYAELLATNLLMEAYNFQGQPELAQNAWQTYRSTLLAQETVFISWLVPLVVASAVGWDANVYTWGAPTYCAVLAGLDLNPGLQRTPWAPNMAPTSYYAPSPVFKKAESLLASLYVTEDADRRIVLYMLYDETLSISGTINAAPLTLTGANSPVPPRTRAQLGTPFQFPGENRVDANWTMSTTFFINRYVFVADSTDQSLADGSYTITDINGQDGLIPVETYLSGPNNIPFLDQYALSYTLSVNEAEPFDFMNFMVYMVPVTAVGWIS
jgi:hypothetical protein